MSLPPFRIAAAALLFGAHAAAQPVPFTGQVAADFAAAVYLADPDPLDVGMPPPLAGASSGFDILGLGLAYDPAADALHVGVATAAIAGDADGDGDPDATGPLLALSGGVDRSQWSGTETFTVALDLDDDGAPDVLAGLPLGADALGFAVAAFQGSLVAPYLAFGAPLAASPGAIAQVPGPGFHDLELTIFGVSSLALAYCQPGQTHLGVHVFLGSFEDGGIGEDDFPGPGLARVPLAALPCFPVLNHLLALGPPAPAAGGSLWTTRYGLPSGYGCCLLASLFDNDVPGWALDWLPGSPLIRIGQPWNPSSIAAFDLGIAALSPLPVSCFEQTWFVPDTVPPGTTLYVQFFAYPTPLTSATAVYASNRLAYFQPIP